MLKFLAESHSRLTQIKMYYRRKPLSVAAASVASLVFALVHIQVFHAHGEDSLGHCPTSSCGKIHNIWFPFRLRGQPQGCGDPRYELDCENNITTLSLQSGKYSVEAINYDNRTIRLVDIGVLEDEQQVGCPFPFPRYFLSTFNLTLFLGYAPIDNEDKTLFAESDKVNNIIYLNCSTGVNDDRYIYIGPCKDAHMYAVLGSLEAGDLKSGCGVKMVSLVAAAGYIAKDSGMPDIRSLQVSGFDLSWSLGLADSKRGTCRIDERGQVHCIFEFSYPTWRIILQHIAVALKILGIRFALGIPCFIILLVYKWRRRHLSLYGTIEKFLQSNTDMMPIRYSYSEIRKMTKGFKDKLGEGGFGSVYRGQLRSGHPAAIKMLKDSKANGQDFISEISTIGRIHHMNVVHLVGYCLEGSKRALVYDFMHNGSLDRYIFSRGEAICQLISWDKLFDISIGVARGIAYLHEGCDVKILHFDIKPHNILLDENFTPKLSDFGLARLYPVDDSIVALTAARGTIGYMAPELFYKNIGGVSHKADVYSFGMMLLDMCGKRRNLNPFVENSSNEIYFPSWIHSQVSGGKEIEIVDASTEERQLVRKMVIVALWCIQMRPGDRPSMKKVVEMLEDEFEGSIEIPPKPSFGPPEENAVQHEHSSWSTVTSSDDEYLYSSQSTAETQHNVTVQ